MMKTADFHYHLPPNLIAQTPAEPRDSSRLMVVDRQTGRIEHRFFRDIGDYLQAGDLLVGNNSRVLPARLFGRKMTGGHVELLLLEKLTDELTWRALVRGKKSRVGTEYHLFDRQEIDSGIRVQIVEEGHEGERVVRFTEPLEPHFGRIGHTPLPPYIRQQSADPERYQTVYSRPVGSAAAPTAGLHFTPDLLLALRDRQIGLEMVTLHVGLDTFKPVEAEEIIDHLIHSEWMELSVLSAARLNQTKLQTRRVVAIGTTSVRVLETAAWRALGIHGTLQTISQQQEESTACAWKPFSPFTGKSDLYIYPPYRFRVVDALITNFHLPQSSLLMLVSAFAGHELIRHAYQVAIAEQYRFFSFGDAMLLI